eukprot:gene7492-11815_t
MSEEQIEITEDNITKDIKKNKYAKKTEKLNWKSFYCAKKKIPKYVHYETAVEYLKNIQLISPVYITVCGVKKDEGCLITRNPTKSENFISLSNFQSDEDSKLVYPAKELGFILQTNCDWWLAM